MFKSLCSYCASLYYLAKGQMITALIIAVVSSALANPLLVPSMPRQTNRFRNNGVPSIGRANPSVLFASRGMKTKDSSMRSVVSSGTFGTNPVLSGNVQLPKLSKATTIIASALGTTGNACAFVSRIPSKCISGGFQSKRNTVICHNSENDDNITEEDIMNCSNSIDKSELGLAKVAAAQLLALWSVTSGFNVFTKPFNTDDIKSNVDAQIVLLNHKLFTSEIILSDIAFRVKNQLTLQFQGRKLSLPLEDTVVGRDDVDEFESDFKAAKANIIKAELGFLDIKNYLIFSSDMEFINDVYELLEQVKEAKKKKHAIHWNLKQYIHQLNWKYAIDKKDFIKFIKLKVADLMAFAQEPEVHQKFGIRQPLDLDELENLILQIERFDYPNWLFEVYDNLCKRRITTILSLNRYIKSDTAPLKRDSGFVDLPLPLVTWKIIYYFLITCSYVAALIPSVLGALVLQLLPVFIFATLNLSPIYGFNPSRILFEFGVNIKDLIKGMAPETLTGVLAERIAIKHPEVRY